MRQANFTLYHAWRCCFGLLLMLAVPIIGEAQTNIIHGAGGVVEPLNACADFFSGDIYTDSGGAGNSYANNENLALTFCAEAGETVSFTFNSFNVESCCDRLAVTGAATGNGNYAGTTLPPVITSSVGGCITFTFTSDGSVTPAGWTATISTSSGCTGSNQEIQHRPPPAIYTACSDFEDGDTYTDSGGPGGNYSNNENSTTQICADAGATVTATFVSFALETCCDRLTVSGAATGNGTYTTTPPAITSTVGGCINFNFTSDISITSSGWVANLTTSVACAPPTADITFCVDLTCEANTPGFAAQAIAFDFNSFNSGPTPLTNTGDNIWCRTETLPVGEVRYNFFYAAAAGAGGPENLAGLNGSACTSTVAGEVKRSYTVVAGQNETVTYAWESCDATAACLTDIEFCVDLSCEADAPGFAAQGLQASFNGYNSGGSPLTNTGNNIWCRTESLPAGDIRFGFFYAAAAGAGGPENLAELPCATPGDGGWKRDYTVVEGVSETLTYAWESCEAESACGALTDITFCVDFTCEADIPGFAAQGLQANFNSFNSGGSPLTNTGNNIWCRTESLPAGDIRFGFFYAAAAGAGGPENLVELPCATDGAGGWKRDYTVVAGMPETLTYAWESCVPEADCGIPGASVEFCVDASCLPDVQNVSIFGGFNGWCGSCNFLSDDDGDGIYCGTIFLAPGNQEYKFLFNGMEESFSEGDPCTTTNFGFTNRLIVVEDGVNQMVTFGFNSCDEVCTPPPGANVEFCVDIGCIMPTGTVNVFGIFPNSFFDPFANPMMQQGPESSIYCTTVFLEPGDTEFKFIINPGMGASEINENFSVGDPCTVSCCDGQFTNRVITVVDGVDQNTSYVFDVPCESTFEEPTVEFPALATICDGTFSYTFTGGATPAGGVYSGEGVTDNGDGTFDVDLAALEPGEYTVTYTLMGDLACVYEATSTLVVEDCGVAITDPCSCNDDASPITFDAAAGTYDNPNDGTFGEVVAITGPMGAALPAGLDFRVVSATGAIGVAAGDALVYNGSIYTIGFDHADDVGYSLTVDQFINGQAVGFNFMIGNACAYPTPVFDPELDPIYCNFEGAITLGGTDDDDINGPDGVTFTINGVAATVFDPTALPSGLNTVVMTYTGADDGNGGVSVDGGTTPAYRGCTQTVETVIEVENFGPACVADLNVTLGANCTSVIKPQMVLTGRYDCADEIIVTVDGGNTDVISGCGAHTYSVDIFVAGELVYTCWGNINAEDKTDPKIDCPANTSTVTQDYAAHQASGNLNAGDATLNFNNYSCLNQGFLADGIHNYDVVTFTTPDFAIPVDVYTILMETAWGDGSMFLFQGGFDPTAPCENLIGSSDDAFVPGGNVFDPALRLSLPLLPNTTYTLVLTNWLTTQFGNWTVSIYSDNNTGVSGPEFTPVNITDTRDLVCEDIDFIRFQTPQSWIASADGTLNFTATRNTFFGGSTAALNAFIAKVNLTGFPVVSDNCGPVKVTLSDAVSSAGDCGDVTLTRTFTVSDRYDGACVGAPRVVACTQTITFRKPTIGDLVFPPFVAPLECDENFAVDANGNPHPSASGYPWIRTAFGFYDLDQTYCNIGASYSDEPRITVCEGTYKLRREWNIIDWCNPGGSGTLNQLIKVFDATGPVISGIPNVINVSTSPFSCLANVAIPCPTLTDGNGCSSVAGTTYTVLAFGESFFAGGDLCDGDVVSAPIGEHILIICAEDACGNETCEEYTVVVTDDIEPTASCNDDINVSIGGGDVANGIEGIARLFAADVDEGSNDNCGEVTLEVRRNYWRNNTCDASASRWSPWGDFVDFYCCDIDNEITIELRVTDEAGNTNICWQVVTPEDKLNPFCYAPAPVTLTCSDLPLAFPGDIATAYDEDFAATSTMMSAIFGGATGTDNCAVDTIVERTPNLQVNDCGWGTITRRFEAWQLRPEGDANGNGAIDINEVYRSTNSCSQLITITEVHDFTIDFPEDADADCGDPDVPTIITTTVGCDVLSVNIGEPVIFSATGDECYKFSITYDVINWCVWDGEYEGLVLPRMTEDDGEALPVDRAVEGNERPVVRVVSGFGPVDNNCDGVADAQQGIQYSVVIDRRHNDRDGDSDIADVIYDNIPGNTPGCIPADQFGRRNYGRYIYTQFVKVYDSTAPVVAVGEYGGPTANCPNLLPGQFGDDDGNCEEAVSIPFSVSDECELFDGAGNLVVSIVSAELDAFAVDANGDGDIKSNEFVADQNVLSLITDNGDGTYVFAGTFPIITNAMGDNVYHAVRVLFEDGCGNQTSETIVFDVIDCKGPAPVCINGLTVTLMPQEDGGCAMAIWASDFEGSPISDCTGQGPELFGGLPRVTKYAIYRAADVEADPNFVPSPDDTGLVLTDQDDPTTVVYVYAFDEDGNYDYCETYVLVQQHVDCGVGGTGTIQGVIATESNETVEGVEVSINGGMSAMMVTNANGTYNFSNLALGGDYTVTPYLNANPLNGVSTFDLVLMSKHILGVQPLDSPYKRIAADINRSNTITTLDMIQLRKLILNIDTQFANNTSWRFVDAAYEFPVATNPWFEAFPELINENNLAGDVLDADFVGVKIGDVNGSAQANALAGDDRTLNGQFNFEVENVSVKAGNVYTVAFRGADMASVEGFQGTLNLNGAELVDIEYGVATAENFGMRYAAEGMITASWNGKATSEDVLFSLVIRPTVDAELSDVINVSSRYTAAEAYGNGNTMNVGVNFSNGAVAVAGFEVYQNTPNPFAATTLIGFNLPADAEATVTISDASGRVLTVVRGDYAAGYNTINLTKEMIQGATGVLTYTVTAGEFTATKKMIAVK
ncbi:CUB domain-containing protein [Lewinella sp. LCG006]|uniref:CUB domain-containing protein n=1 Tax=Lewinella sp. LCG006 TaxID=3231911 RepID=UPI00345F6F19